MAYQLTKFTGLLHVFYLQRVFNREWQGVKPNACTNGTHHPFTCGASCRFW